MIDVKPILITGSHRSGSTWVGKILTQSASVGYIHEPFNLDHPLGVCGVKFDYWFTYITEENELVYDRTLTDTINFRYNLYLQIKELNSLRDAGRLIRDSTNFLKYRYYGVRPLIKDPIAFFSSEWLAEKFNMDVVVLIRHPAAFISSLKAKQWYFTFSHFLEQPLLMRDYLNPFTEEISQCALGECDIIEQGILLWKIFFIVTLEYQKTHKDWIFIKHEDISRNPILEFQNLFKKLDLEFTEKIQNQILKYSNQEIKNDLLKKSNLPLIWSEIETRRNSKSNINAWKKRLTASEIEKIKTELGELSSFFYSDEDW